MDVPVGAAGPHTRRHHRELVREKYLATGGPERVADEVDGLESLSPRPTGRLVTAALE
jgi:hypothetical protein